MYNLEGDLREGAAGRGCGKGVREGGAGGG